MNEEEFLATLQDVVKQLNTLRESDITFRSGKTHVATLIKSTSELAEAYASRITYRANRVSKPGTYGL